MPEFLVDRDGYLFPSTPELVATNRFRPASKDEVDAWYAKLGLKSPLAAPEPVVKAEPKPLKIEK